MKYLVEAHPSMEAGNRIDSKEGGPGPVFGYIAERFKPEAMYGNPTRRQIFIVVDLPTERDIAELMYVLTWFTDTEPTFSPVMDPRLYMDAIVQAQKAPKI
ncbi:MAG: hypothetical protein JOZ87_17110 [Chloroflexi bacterium]|nr:hypothetical protein [Chloroflexota bacterium]